MTHLGPHPAGFGLTTHKGDTTMCTACDADFPVPPTYITVGQLRELLANVPDDTPVILQRDAEGNGYSPLDAVTPGMYVPDTAWSGEVYPTPEQLAELTAIEAWSEDDAAPDDAIPCIVLEPAN